MDVAIRILFCLSLQKNSTTDFCWRSRTTGKAVVCAQGDYDEALIYTGQGRDLASSWPSAHAAVMEVMESWLLFSRQVEGCGARFRSSRGRSPPHDDHVTLGNIQSFYGRMAREKALDKASIFLRAPSSITASAIQASQPGALARQHGLAKRGIASNCSAESIWMHSATQEFGKAGKASAGATGIAARPDIAAASRNCAARRLNISMPRAKLPAAAHASCLGTVHLNAAYIHLDGGDYQRAEEESASAYELAKEKTTTS